jgi:hypothetical protein
MPCLRADKPRTRGTTSVDGLCVPQPPSLKPILVTHVRSQSYFALILYRKCTQVLLRAPNTLSSVYHAQNQVEMGTRMHVSDEAGGRYCC